MSVWVASRAAGLGALWLLVASAALGYGARLAGSVRPRWVRPLHYLHGALAAAGWLGALVHALLLRYDDFMPFRWQDLFVPFSASYRPVWTGLGILALYGWGFTLLTFDGRQSFGSRAFKALHRAWPAVLLLAGLHGIGAGSDGHMAALRWGALLAGVMAVAGAIPKERVARLPRPLGSPLQRLQAVGFKLAAPGRPTPDAATWRRWQALPTGGVREAHADPRGGR